jgi:hypothetical protein
MDVRDMTFRDVMDLLCLSADEAATQLGTVPQHVRQFRLDPGKAGHRRPPDGWKTTFAALARDRGWKLLALAAELEGEG